MKYKGRISFELELEPIEEPKPPPPEPEEPQGEVIYHYKAGKPTADEYRGYMLNPQTPGISMHTGVGRPYAPVRSGHPRPVIDCEVGQLAALTDREMPTIDDSGTMEYWRTHPSIDAHCQTMAHNSLNPGSWYDKFYLLTNYEGKRYRRYHKLIMQLTDDLETIQENAGSYQQWWQINPQSKAGWTGPAFNPNLSLEIRNGVQDGVADPEKAYWNFVVRGAVDTTGYSHVSDNRANSLTFNYWDIETHRPVTWEIIEELDYTGQNSYVLISKDGGPIKIIDHPNNYPLGINAGGAPAIRNHVACFGLYTYAGGELSGLVSEYKIKELEV